MSSEIRSNEDLRNTDEVFHIEGVGAVRAWGDPEKHLVILLHGFMQTGNSWGRIAPLLTHFRVLAPDLLGHGKTAFNPGDRLRFEEYLEQLKRLIDWARKADPSGRTKQVSLVGYSLGGRIAALYATTYPEDIAVLALESAGLGPRNEEERVSRAQKTQKMIAALDRSVAADPSDPLAGFVDFWETLPLFETQSSLPLELRAALREERLANDPAALRQNLEDAGQHRIADLRGPLANLNKPLLYLVGERDVAYTEIARSLMRTWAEEQRDSDLLNRGVVQVSVIPQAGHNTHLESPEAFARAVNLFLSQNA